MNKKQFAQEFCDTRTIQKFLHSQNIIWDGTNYVDAPYDMGNFDHESVWLATENSDFPVLARFDITPLNFVIVREAFLADEQKLAGKKFMEFGKEWRSFMSQENDAYLPVAGKYLYDLRRAVIDHSFKTRDDLQKGMSSIQKAYQAKIILAETNEECAKWNSLLAAKKTEYQTKMAKVNIDTRSKIVILQKVDDELEALSQKKEVEQCHEK